MAVVAIAMRDGNGRGGNRMRDGNGRGDNRVRGVNGHGDNRMRDVNGRGDKPGLLPGLSHYGPTAQWVSGGMIRPITRPISGPQACHVIDRAGGPVLASPKIPAL